MIEIANILTPGELDRVHAILASAPWEAGRDTAGVQAASIKNNEQLSHECQEMRDIRQIVLQALDRHPVFFSATLPRRVFPPRVNRYAGNANTFGAHVDNAIRYLPQSGQRMRTDLSCTLFLSAPESYDGGELVMHGLHGNTSPPKVKLKAGDAIVYSASTVHEVLPVTRGARIACFFWIESMVRDASARQILFELDRTIINLRNEYGDNAHTIALTGTYHNLLRQWADA
jgi:PKHD-type hydroxylase